MKCSSCQGGTPGQYKCPGCIDRLVRDPESNEAILARHRAASSQWPNGRPETHTERALREAVDHLDRVLNGCRSHAEQLAADTAARNFLQSICK